MSWLVSIASVLFLALSPSISYSQYTVGQSELDESVSLGTGQTRFVGPNFDKQVTYDDKGDYGIIEGDIIVPLNSTVLPTLDPLYGSSSVVINGFRWLDRTLYYRFDNVTTQTRNIVLDAVNHISSRSAVHFVELSSPSRYHVRIRDTAGGGCSSRVGYKVYQSEINQGYQNLNLARPVGNSGHCLYLGVAVHELMHALGFWHEQSREDRNLHSLPLTIKMSLLLQKIIGINLTSIFRMVLTWGLMITVH